MRIISFGMCSMLIMVTMIKLLLVIGEPYERHEELVYSSELSTKKAIKTASEEGYVGDIRKLLSDTLNETLEGGKEASVENVYYNPTEKSISVDYVLKFRLLSGKEKTIRLNRKARVME